MYFTPRTNAYVPLPDDAGAVEPPVVVVGAGPVGLAAALSLARRGVRVLVLEAGDSVSHGSRAICLSRQSLQILDRIGVGDRFAELSLPWVSGRSFYRDRQVLSFDMPADPGLARPPMVNISQSVAEQVLVEAAAADDRVSLHWRSRVVGVRPVPEAARADAREQSVELDVETPDGVRRLTASWVVAADGARSTVRDQLGLRMRGTSYEGRYVIADIHWPVDRPTERLVWFDPPSNPGATIIMHRQPDDIWRVDYQLAPDADPEAEVDPERVRQRIARHLDWLGSTVPWTLEWVSLYRAHSLSLDSYRHGRVLFAGDAAHLVPIFGVRGLNSGLEDADDLAWKLALVVHGAAADALLDTYASERRDAWQQNVDQAGKSTRFMTPGSHGYEVTREAVLALSLTRPEVRALVDPRQSSATHARASSITCAADDELDPRPGDVVPDRLVHLPDGSVSRLREVTGPDLALLARGVDHERLAGAEQELSSALGGALAVRAVDVGVDVLDHDGSLAEALGLQGGGLVVLRPDGRLLGRFRDPGMVREVAQLLVLGGRSGEVAAVGSVGNDAASLGVVETAWRSISELLDATAPEEREVALTRLAMLLALELGDRPGAQTRLQDLVREALNGPSSVGERAG